MEAFVDESMLMKPGGVYVIAAVITDGPTDGQRHALRAAVVHRRRWHWHSEEHDDRCRLLDCLAGLDCQFVVSWVPMDDPRRQERARAIALVRLLWEFQAIGVDGITFEFRQPALNRRDQETIERTRRAGHLSRTLTYRFTSPSTDALLWAADALAGAARSAVGAGDHDYLRRLGEERVAIHRATH